MRAVGLRQPGGVEELFIEEVPLPSLEPDHVLVQVHGCGVNRPDVLQRKGLYPPPPDADPRLGLEISGVVVAIGEGVANPVVGASVMALCNGGGYAGYVAVPAGQCMKIPQGVSLVDAATLPETYLTVWQNLFVKAGLKSGQTVLVHGGSSGIGVAAIQLAKMHGAKVVVTVGSPEKVGFCMALGADHAIDYKQSDWSEGVRGLYPEGVDVILDMVAGDYLEKGLGCLAPGGQLIVIALLGGRFGTIDAAKLMAKQAVLTGSTLRPRSADFKAMLAEQVERELERGFTNGLVKTTVTARFALEAVADAHSLMESSGHAGKIVLELLA